VVLDAMQGRPESSDTTAASVLRDYAESRELSVGRMLVEAAQAGNQDRINRLFAVYSQELQALQPELASAEPGKRAAAVFRLRIYGPLAQRELEHALQDPDVRVRQSAARGIAKAEGLTLIQAAGKHLQTGGSLDAQRPWLEALAHEKNCQAVLLTVAEDVRQPILVRGEALGQLPECSEWTGERAQRVLPFLKEAQPPLRVAERDQPLRHELHAHRRAVRLGQLLGQQRRNPVAPEQFAHRRARAGAADVVVLLGSQHRVASPRSRDYVPLRGTQFFYIQARIIPLFWDRPTQVFSAWPQRFGSAPPRMSPKAARSSSAASIRAG